MDEYRSYFATLNLQYGSFDTAMIKFENDRDRYISSIQGIVSVLTLITLIIYIIAPVFWNDLLELPSILVLAMIVEILMSTVLAFGQINNVLCININQ